MYMCEGVRVGYYVNSTVLKRTDYYTNQVFYYVILTSARLIWSSHDCTFGPNLLSFIAREMRLLFYTNRVLRTNV